MVDLPTLTESQLVPPAPAVRFSATKRIPPTPAEGLDETWREKVERQRKRRRKRRRRARLLNRCLEKGRASRKLGILLLLGIIGVTVGLLYLNHRSGGQLLGRGLGH